MVSLAEFASKQPPTAGAANRWFAEHPGLIDEVTAGLLRGIPVETVWRWLRDEHGYPLSHTTIHGLRARITR